MPDFDGEDKPLEQDTIENLPAGNGQSKENGISATDRNLGNN
jgi:hypothetical protein